MSFIQTGTPLKSFVKMTDRTTPSSQALFNGSPVYLHAAEQTMAVDAIKATRSKPMPSMPDLLAASKYTSGMSGSFNDMKGPTSFMGINNPKMTVQCTWSSDLVNTYNDKLLMNPYIALLMVSSGRRFYLEDERIVNAIKTWDLNTTNTMYPNGMPVTIDSLTFGASARDRSMTTINFTLTEDKE